MEAPDKFMYPLLEVHDKMNIGRLSQIIILPTAGSIGNLTYLLTNKSNSKLII